MPINPYNNGSVPQAPFGDIFAVRTPKTDAAVNRLQQQAWQSRQYEQQQRMAQAAALDKDYDRQLAGVRDADVDDVANAYTEYKQAKTDLLFNPAYKKDMAARAKAEARANQLNAAFHSTVQESKTAIGYFKALNGGMLKKPYDYNENAEEMLNSTNALTTKQLKEQGLLNGEAWMQQDEDLNPVQKLAYGQDREFNVLVDDKANGGLTRRSLTYRAPNEPKSFQTGWLTGLNTKRKVGTMVRDFERNVSESDFALAENEYRNSLQDKERWARWGIAPQPISYNADSELEKAVAYKTYRHFLDNEPAAKKETNVINPDAMADRRMDDWLKKNKITYGQRRALMLYGQELKDAGLDNTWSFDAQEAIVGNDPVEIEKVVNRAWVGTKGGAKVTKVDLPNRQASPLSNSPTADNVVIHYTKREKNPTTFKYEDVEQPPIVLEANDPKLLFKLARFQGETMGIKAKILNEIGTGRGQAPVKKKAPAKKTKSVLPTGTIR